MNLRRLFYNLNILRRSSRNCIPPLNIQWLAATSGPAPAPTSKAALKAMPGEYWTDDQINSLLQQVVIEQKHLPQLHVPGKSMAAINNQRRRLKEAGLVQKAFTGRKLVPWNICELRQLEKLTREYGFSAAFIAQLQLIPGRSRYAISKMMGRHGLGDPAVKERAKTAQRLTQEQRHELERFLLHDGRLQSCAQVARKWGLAEQTVNSYRRRLGVPLSWQEARRSQEYCRYEEMRRRLFQEALKKRWEQWRTQREQRLRALRSHLGASPNSSITSARVSPLS